MTKHQFSLKTILICNFIRAVINTGCRPLFRMQQKYLLFFLKWQPGHFPVMDICFVVWINLHLSEKSVSTSFWVRTAPTSWFKYTTVKVAKWFIKRKQQKKEFIITNFVKLTNTMSNMNTFKDCHFLQCNHYLFCIYVKDGMQNRGLGSVYQN